MTAIRFAVLAQRDFERIELYYRVIYPDVATRIIDAILAATRLLRDLPRAGSTMRRGQRRKWRVGGTPYIVVYRVATDHIRILRVIHGAQRAAGL